MADWIIKRCLNCELPLDGGMASRRYCDRRCTNRHYKRIRRGVMPKPRIPAGRMTMPRDQLAWVAGIIEGEGSITAKTRAQSPPNYHMVVRVGMTDEDVVRRLGAITGVGRINGPHLYNTRAGNKPFWSWDVNRRDEVLTLLGAIWPYLGERRRQQTSATITKWRTSGGRRAKAA